MSLTDPGGSATAALQALQTLAQTAARTIHGLLEGLLHRSPIARASRTVAPRPAPQALPAEPRRGDPATPPADGASTQAQPPAYGQSRVVLVARDPWSLFAHWDIQPVRRVEVLRGLGVEGEHAEEVLRLYDTVPQVSFRDLVLAPGAARAHLEVADAGRTYRIEVGLRTSTGRFVPLAASNLATTPAAQPSEDTSVRWVSPRTDRASAEVGAPWNGQRVVAATTATALEPPTRVASSEGLPPGPRASDALPFR